MQPCHRTWAHRPRRCRGRPRRWCCRCSCPHQRQVLQPPLVLLQLRGLEWPGLQQVLVRLLSLRQGQHHLQVPWVQGSCHQPHWP